jgi:hypothetical protein
MASRLRRREVQEDAARTWSMVRSFVDEETIRFENASLRFDGEVEPLFPRSVVTNNVSRKGDDLCAL